MWSWSRKTKRETRSCHVLCFFFSALTTSDRDNPPTSAAICCDATAAIRIQDHMLAAVRSDELRRRLPRSSRPNSLALASRGPAQLMEARVRAIIRVYLFVFFSKSRRLPETKFRPKFRRNSLIPNGKRIQIQKTKFRWIPTEISVISTEIRWFSTGKLCNLCFSYCSRGQMKNFWIPTLFSFSRSTTFVLRTFSFEQWFESYLIISKTTN